MKSKHISAREIVLIFESGDKVSEQLLAFVNAENIPTCHFHAIGAFANVTIAYFNLKTKQYEKIEINEQLEVASLIGNVGWYDGAPNVHAHVCLGKRDGTASAGHLIEGEVRPTLEMFMTISDEPLCRRQDEATGLPLIDLDVRA